MSILSILLGLGAKKVSAPGRGTPRPKAATPDIVRAFEDPKRQERLRKARSLLTDLGPELAARLVDGVARKFFSYAVDIPAAENHHHARSFGLFDHSLDAGERALRAAQVRHFVADTKAYPEVQEHRVPRLRYAAWFLGLLHDSGKIVQVTICAPHEIVWNPYVEPLEDFYLRHGREKCTFSWVRGRGLDAHNWQNAFLTGTFLRSEVAEYLGRSITAELIENRTPAAREVHDIVADADRKSTDRDRHHRSDKETVTDAEEMVEPPASPVAIGGTEFIDRIPEILAAALRDKTLLTSETGGDVLLGRSHVLLRYPRAVGKLAHCIRTALGREYARARKLHVSDEGARELARYLHEHHKLVYHSESDWWKLKARISCGEACETDYVIVLHRSFLETAVQPYPLFTGKIALTRSEGDHPVPVDDWQGTERKTAPTEEVLPKPNEARTPEAALSPEANDVPAPTGPVAPPVLMPRRFISPEVLFDDLRVAILTGIIPSNETNQPCYVLPDVTYLASPRGFQCLYVKRLYPRDPAREITAYLDALAKIPAVRKLPKGNRVMVLRRVSVRPGARPLWVVAFDTQGLFRSQAEIAQVGIWTKTPIRELSDEEIRAAQDPSHRTPAIGVAHA